MEIVWLLVKVLLAIAFLAVIGGILQTEYFHRKMKQASFERLTSSIEEKIASAIREAKKSPEHLERIALELNRSVCTNEGWELAKMTPSGAQKAAEATELFTLGLCATFGQLSFYRETADRAEAIAKQAVSTFRQKMAGSVTQ